MKSKKSIKEQGIVRTQDKLRKLVNELHDQATQSVTPRYPMILVFALPKASMQGRIYLPDQQNKPIHEGIVLRTYNPFYRHLRITRGVEGTEGSGISEELKVLVEPSVKVGDHVIFPHASGIPVMHMNMNQHSGLSSHGDFRLIRDDITEQGGMLYGGIMGVLEYTTDDLKEELKKVILNNRISNKATTIDIPKESELKVVQAITDHFILLDRALRPRTTSGA